MVIAIYMMEKNMESNTNLSTETLDKKRKEKNALKVFFSLTKKKEFIKKYNLEGLDSEELTKKNKELLNMQYICFLQYKEIKFLINFLKLMKRDFKLQGKLSIVTFERISSQLFKKLMTTFENYGDCFLKELLIYIQENFNESYVTIDFIFNQTEKQKLEKLEKLVNSKEFATIIEKLNNYMISNFISRKKF